MPRVRLAREAATSDVWDWRRTPPAATLRLEPPVTLTVDHDRAPDDPRGPLLAGLRGLTVSIIGYGNQGRAHAQNLRDSGVEVVVGARDQSRSGGLARADGFIARAVRDASAAGDLVIVALPDEVHGEVCARDILPALQPTAVIGFLHGLSVHFGHVLPPAEVGVVMVAPKGPGATLRQRYLEGRGIPCLLAVHGASGAAATDATETPMARALELGLAWASGLGCGRAGIVHTSFAHEAETDLFGEQAVLCGGAMALAQAAFETLVEHGYPEELAYLECVHELKQVVDLLFERGFAGMRRAISNTAEFGAYRAGPILVDDAVRGRLRELLESIRRGDFARAFAEDTARGMPWFNEQRRIAASHPIDRAGAVVRTWMPWMLGSGNTAGWSQNSNDQHSDETR